MSPTSKSHVRRMPFEYEKAQARKVRITRRKDFACFVFVATVALTICFYFLNAGQ